MNARASGRHGGSQEQDIRRDDARAARARRDRRRAHTARSAATLGPSASLRRAAGDPACLRAPRGGPNVDTSGALREEIASLQVAVDALDDRFSAEVVEREAKLLEEIRRGMRGLETELSDRFAAATLEMKRSNQRSAALVVGFVALLAGLVVGVLSGL